MQQTQNRGGREKGETEKRVTHTHSYFTLLTRERSKYHDAILVNRERGFNVVGSPDRVPQMV